MLLEHVSVEGEAVDDWWLEAVPSKGWVPFFSRGERGHRAALTMDCSSGLCPEAEAVLVTLRAPAFPSPCGALPCLL